MIHFNKTTILAILFSVLTNIIAIVGMDDHRSTIGGIGILIERIRRPIQPSINTNSSTDADFASTMEEGDNDEDFRNQDKCNSTEDWQHLYNAISSGDLNQVALLVERGVSVNIKDISFFDSSPLCEAIFNGNPEMVQLLLEHHAYHKHAVDRVITFHTSKGNEEQKTAIVNSLLCAGIKPSGDAEVLCRAAEESYCNIISLLLAQGVSVNAVNFTRNSPLHRAIQCSKPNVVRLLLEYGADVTLKDMAGYAPAIWAVHQKDAPIITELGNSLSRVLPYAQSYIALHCYKFLPLELVKLIIDWNTTPNEVPLFERISRCATVRTVLQRLEQS